MSGLGGVGSPGNLWNEPAADEESAAPPVGPAAPDAGRDEAQVDRIPGLAPAARDRLKLEIRRGGPVPWLDPATRDLLAAEPDPARRQAIVSADLDDDGFVRPGELLDRQRRAAAP